MTQCHIQEKRNPQPHSCKNPKTCNVLGKCHVCLRAERDHLQHLPKTHNKLQYSEPEHITVIHGNTGTAASAVLAATTQNGVDEGVMQVV